MADGPLSISGKTTERSSGRSLRSKASDVDLVSACLKGNSESWSALIARYQGVIFSVALKRGLSRSDAEDVFQNVCLKLYEHLDELRDIQRLSAWLISVTSRECAQIYRRESARPLSETEIEGDDREPYASIHASPGLTPEEEILAIERRQLIKETMGDLSNECRMLLTMLYNRETEMSYAEIAEKLSIPLGSIGPRRARCLARLRVLMDKHGYR